MQETVETAVAMLVDAILVGVALEGVLLAVVLVRRGQGARLRGLLPTLAAGACLLGALKAALAGATPWILAALTGALVAHVVDLATRLRGGPDAGGARLPGGAGRGPDRRLPY